MKFDLIAADPPWHFKNWSGDSAGEMVDRGHGAARHYPTMTIDDICQLPVDQIAAPDSVLLLWMVWTHLPEALQVIGAWGFTYKSRAFTWAKANPSGFGFWMGMGYHTRANDEVCLLATRGKGLQRKDRAVRSLIYAPVQEHSKKPEAFYSRSERLYGEVDRVELFSRRKRDGWSHWGNEVDSDIEMSASHDIRT